MNNLLTNSATDILNRVNSADDQPDLKAKQPDKGSGVKVSDCVNFE